MGGVERGRDREHELEDEMDAWVSYAGELEREILARRRYTEELEQKISEMTLEMGALYRALDPYGFRE